MGEYFTQLDFSQIAGHPHRLPDKAVEKLPMFTGTDATCNVLFQLGLKAPKPLTYVIPVGSSGY